jgi:transcriptional regulator with AAA-type ATPase domain
MYIECTFTLTHIDWNVGMPLFSTADRQFLESVSRVAFSNPFLPERIEFERAALGDEYQPGSGRVWSRRSDVEETQPNVERLSARATAIVDLARESLVADKRASDAELTLYEDVAQYVLYDQFRPQFQEAVQAAIAGDAPPKVACWHDFQRQFDRYFALSGVRLPTDFDPAHVFAGFFQIRRAFHHIFDSILGESMPTARLRAAVWQSIFTHDLRRYRRSLYLRMHDISTLVVGPSGTGKELVARAVGLSRYIPFDVKKQCFTDDFLDSFHAVNLSALAPTLIESDLFGHAKGTFTGATTDRVGWLEQCKPLGTVFLDEIGELDPSIQVKLLRVVQARAFSRLGETELRSFDGKIIAATNRDLAEEMRAGRFRDDLYYRLCSDLIRTTPLSEQLADTPEDLHNLVLFIAQRIAGDDADALAGEVEAWIDQHLGRDYAWPGNIRELEQCVRNCLVRGTYKPPTTSDPTAASRADWLEQAAAGTLTADELLSHYCRSVHAQLGTYEATAERLGLDRRTVRRKVVKD